MKLPPGVTLPFPWVRVRGDRAYISGHAPQNADGSLAAPLGKVDADVSLEEGYQAAAGRPRRWAGWGGEVTQSGAACTRRRLA